MISHEYKIQSPSNLTLFITFIDLWLDVDLMGMNTNCCCHLGTLVVNAQNTSMITMT